MKVLSIALSIISFQLSYAIESDIIPKKSLESIQQHEVSETTDCQEFLPAYTGIMKEAYSNLDNTAWTLLTQAFLRGLPEADHIQILTEKTVILRHHIIYLQTIMQMMEQSHCLDSIYSSRLRGKTIPMVFQKTRDFLQHLSSIISMGLQKLELDPSITNIVNIIRSIFNNDSYGEMHRDITMCIEIIEEHIQSKENIQ